MKTLVLFFSLFTFFANAQKYDLEVTISGFKKPGGKVYAAIYDNESTFLKKQKYGTIKPIDGDKITIIFNNVPAGTYAVSCYYDANNNGKLDSNFLGIPKEQYGTSNGATGFMGPPKYEDAKFTLSENKKISIKL
jgi:uncharacterized protein (DUF2141 family)